MDTRAYGHSLNVYLVTFWIEASTGIFRALLLGLLMLPVGFLLLLVYLLLSGVLDHVRPFEIGELIFQSLVIGLWLSLFIGGLLAYAPLGLSMLSYWGAGGGYGLTRFALGARPPSTREEQTLQQELTAIQGALNRDILTFSRILILDTPVERVYTIGTTLYISSEAVRNSRHLGALLAHELGHLNHGDGGIVLSLRRLVFPLFYLFIGNVTNFSTGRFGSGRGQQRDPSPADIYYSMVNAVIFFVFAAAGGGLGVWLCSFWWADYFRKRDYLADQFVVECGLQDPLVDYLERNLFYDVSVPYMLGWQPANELRLDRLLNPQAGLSLASTALVAESATRKYGGLLLLSFVAALFFGMMVPLPFGFLLSFVLFVAVGLFFRGDINEIRALAQRLFQANTQLGQYLRVTGLAFLIALFVNLVTLPSWPRFWLFFLVAWVGMYGLRRWALGVNDLGAALTALYAYLAGVYNRWKYGGWSGSTQVSGPSATPSSALPPSNPSIPQPSGSGSGPGTSQQTTGGGGNPFTQRRSVSGRQTLFQRRILEVAAQRGPDVVSLQDIRNLLVEVVTQYSGMNLTAIRAEITRLIDGEYLTLRADVRSALEELQADPTPLTAQDVIQWLDQRLGRS